jgi:hypothetical protein
MWEEVNEEKWPTEWFPPMFVKQIPYLVIIWPGLKVINWNICHAVYLIFMSLGDVENVAGFERGTFLNFWLNKKLIFLWDTVVETVI